jgi:hypothetical protein
MEINQETINQFLSLSDEDLKTAFQSIGAALGLNERIVAANTGRFKRMIASTSPKDLERLLSSMDPVKAQQVLNTVNKTK